MINSVFHLGSSEEALCDEAVKLISTGRKGDETQIAQNILKKISVGAPSNLLSRVCHVLSRGKKTRQDSSILSKIADVCFDKICPGFSKNSIGEQIAFAKETRQQAALVQFLVQPGSKSIDQVFGYWSNLGLGLQENLELCHSVASEGKEEAEALASNFNMLGLEKATVEERSELCNTIASQGYLALDRLVNRFAECFLQDIEKLQTLEERLELCGRIASQGEWAVSGLVRDFAALGFLQEIKRLPQMGERLKLSIMIASQGEWAARGLVSFFDRLDLENAPIEDRLDLFKMIAWQGPTAASSLVWFFSKLGLESATTKDRLDLFKMIASHGYLAAYSLAVDYNILGLEGAPVEDRLELCKMIATDLSAEEILIIKFAALGFWQDVIRLPQVQDRLELCKVIASQGRWAARYLAGNFNKLGLEGALIGDYLELFRTIASQGQSAAQYLAENFAALKDAPVEDRLELCKMIAASGDEGVKSLVQNFKELGLEESDEACVSLAQVFAAMGYQRNFDYYHVSGCIKNKSIKRQAYLEIWRPPSDYRGEFVSSLSAGFAAELEPLLNVLHRKEGVPFSIYKESLGTFLIKNEKLAWLLPLLEQIDEIEEEFIKLALLDFTAYTVGVLYDLTDSQLEAIKQSGIVQVIFNHENPLNRYRFMRLLSNVVKHNPDNLLAWRIGVEWDHSSLSRILLSHLFTSKKDTASINKIIERIDVKAFKPISKFNSIVQFLSSINNGGSYTDSELSLIRETVADVIGQKKGKKSGPVKKLLTRMNSLTTILNVFGKEKFLNCLREKRDSVEFLRSHFQDFFNVGDLHQFVEKYQSTIGRFRDEGAIFTYARCVNSLPCWEKEKVRDALNIYVRAVLEGTFPDIRYDTTSSPHLAQVFSNPDIQNKWCAQQETIQISLASEIPLGKPDYKTFFTQKILTDMHIDPRLLPRLVSYLNTEQAEIIDSQEPLEQLQNFAIQLLRGDENVEEFIRKVDALPDIPTLFKQDLEALNPKKGTGFSTIQESDEACDLLLIGTEIRGSCQSVYGSSHLNKCLVSYLMNGEVRPIVIKQNNRIVARSVMRLMWDEANQTPVILLERTYSNVAGPQLKNHIIEWAKRKAESMRLPLVSVEVGDGLPYQGNVGHLGGFAPYIYSDASGGILEDPFQIKWCRALYLPTDVH